MPSVKPPDPDPDLFSRVTRDRGSHHFTMDEVNMKNMLPKWTRFCWWLSRKLGGMKVFGKQDLT